VRKKMIDSTSKLSVSRQAIILGISRGRVNYRPRPVTEADLKPMHRIDKLHMEFPFAGSRMLQGLLVQEGFKVGRLPFATLMKRMGVEALYRKPNTSRPTPGHMIYPHLLRKLPITRPNQVWAMDTTQIPMARAFIRLAAVLDWFTRRVLAGRVSITLEPDFCMEAVEDALARHGVPEIFNTDQGSQFTSTDFIKLLAAREIKISMDGKGAWRDHGFVERLWRTIKCEEVYVRAYASVSEARASIGRCLAFYNSRRPHSSLVGKTPDQACFNQPMPERVAA
jgi:putative transposase